MSEVDEQIHKGLPGICGDQEEMLDKSPLKSDIPD